MDLIGLQPFEQEPEVGIPYRCPDNQHDAGNEIWVEGSLLPRKALHKRRQDQECSDRALYKPLPATQESPTPFRIGSGPDLAR